MPRAFDDTAVVLNSLPDYEPAIDPAILRRALRFGQKARDRHPHGRFDDLEPGGKRRARARTGTAWRARPGSGSTRAT
jgi:hypothetical protein